jgi:hypothetical protein
MIRTDESLAVQQRLLGNLERALEDLRADVEPKNPRNFAIYAEAYIDQIDLLKAEIEEYLAKKKTAMPEAHGAQSPVAHDPKPVS